MLWTLFITYILLLADSPVRKEEQSLDKGICQLKEE